MEYKILNTTRGVRYMKGSKFCSIKDIPEDVLQRLNNQETVNTTRDCPFCGGAGTEEKTLNSVRYYLCLEHYDTKTTGELAQTIDSRSA